MAARIQRASQLLETLAGQLQQARGAKAAPVKLPVLLLQEVEGVGASGKLARVNHGFARNYLIPKRKAVIAHRADDEAEAASSGGGAQAAADEVPRGLAQQQRQAEAAIKKLITSPVTIKRKTGDGQRLDMPVSKQDIADAVARQLRVALAPELLDIGTDRLAVVGEYRLPLKLVLPSGERAALDVNISST
eukprot:scaffold5.g764.t1